MSSGFSQRFCSSSAAPRHQGLVTIEGCLSSGGCGIFMKATKPHVLRILKVKHGKTLKSELNLKALGLAKWLRVVLLSKGTARSQANTHQRPGGSSKTMPCLPSPSHHHFYRWYVYHSQSWLVFDFLFYPHTTLLYIYIIYFENSPHCMLCYLFNWFFQGHGYLDLDLLGLQLLWQTIGFPIC